MARLAITVALLALGASGFRTGEAAGLRTGGLRAAFALWEPAARPARPRWLETLRRGGACPHRCCCQGHLPLWRVFKSH